MIQFQVSVTKKEYKKVTIQNFFRRFWVIYFLIPIFIGNILFTGSMYHFDSRFLIKVLLPNVILFVLFITLFYLSLNRNTEKIFKKLPIFNEKIIYTVDENGLFIKGESFEITMPWNKFDYIWVKGDFLIFYQPSSFGNIIPKRNLTAEQLDTLLQYARTANLKVKGLKQA